jgi:hypothetical protein
MNYLLQRPDKIIVIKGLRNSYLQCNLVNISGSFIPETKMVKLSVFLKT